MSCLIYFHRHNICTADIMRSKDIISDANSILEAEGVHSTLKFLNKRTPHRFTGIYRFDGDMLRNVYLFDQFEPSLTKGQDVPMVDAYCANVGRAGCGIEFSDVGSDQKIQIKSRSPVISYCGALILDSQQNPYGTLCHYDVKPCDEPVSDLPALETVAPLIYKALLREKMPEKSSPIADDPT